MILWINGYVMLIILASHSLCPKYKLITKVSTTPKFLRMKRRVTINKLIYCFLIYTVIP